MKTARLNLPDFSFKITGGEKPLIFDPFRKKYVTLTPEEWVRQNFLRYLVEYKKYPSSLMVVENSLKTRQRSMRSDILVYSREGEPWLMVECKAPEIKINQEVFDQIARYNMKLKVPYLIVTNGMVHYCCQLDYTNNSWSFIKDVPDYPSK